MLSPARRAATATPGRHGPILLLVALMLLTSLAGAVLPAPRSALAATATTTTALNLRSGPGTGYAVLRVIPQGASVTVDGDPQNGFSQVVYAGTAGWAATSFLALSGGGGGGGATTGTATTTTSLNLRSGAGTGYSVLRVMPAGATVTLTGIDQNGYYYVVYNGVQGWAASQFLSLGGTSGGGTSGSGSGWGEVGSTEEVIQIIYAAADRYGQPREDMLRVARCESGLNPNAVNPAGSYGLFQFIPSTWASTPYAQYDIFDAWASANAAGWMWSVGRRGEWVCQ